MQVHTVEGYIETLFVVAYPDGRVLLLDGGCHCDYGRIAEALQKKLGMKWESVSLQVASHMHPDHAGAAPLIRSRHGIPLAAPCGINRWYAGLGGFLQHKVDISLAYMVAGKHQRPFRNVFYGRKIEFDHALKDGDTLPGFPDWRVIATPGHTAHDVVFYHEQTRTLYAADVMLQIRNQFHLPFPVPMEDRMRDSLMRLRELRVEKLLLAHGGVVMVENLHGPVDALISRLDSEWMTPFFKKISPLTRLSRDILRTTRKKNKNAR